MLTGLPQHLWPVLVGYATAAAVQAALAGYALRYRRENATARAFGVVAAALAVWAGAYAVRLAATSLPAKLLWTGVAYVGIVVLPGAWLVFALRYAGVHRLVTRRTVALLSVHPVVTLAALATNQSHRAFYGSVGLYAGGGWPVIASEGVGWFWVHTAYAYLVFGAGTVLLVGHAVLRRRRYRVQSAALAAGALLPWVVNAAFLADLRPYPHVDLTPVGFAVGAVPIAVAALGVTTPDLLPVARDVVMDTVADAIVVVDARGRVVDANDRARALVGGAGVVGRPAREALPGPVVDTGALDGPIDGGIECSVTIDGEQRWLWVRRRAIRREGASGAILTLTDITTRTAQRERLERKTERLENLASVVSHDLRNPLDVAQGYRRLLAEDVDADGEVAEHLAAIQRAHERMDQIAADLLVLARERPEGLRRREVDLADLAGRAWETVDTGDLDLAVGDPGTVEADPDRLRHVFENLYRNATEHAAGATTVWVGGYDGGFYVEDDGPGVPPDRRRAVFEHGHTTEADGSGLGLSIVRDVVGAHGWSVAVADGRVGGARFEVATASPAVEPDLAEELVGVYDAGPPVGGRADD